MPWQSSDFQSNENDINSIQTGVQIGLFGSLISIFGDAVELIGDYIAFQEAQQADAQLQQQLTQINNSLEKLADQNKVSGLDSMPSVVQKLQEEKNELIIKNLQLEIRQLRAEKASHEKNIQARHLRNNEK